MIKPCPFCNGISDTDRVTWSDGSFCYKGICSKCGSSTKAYNTEQEAIDAWNKRPREGELLDALDEVVKVHEDDRRKCPAVEYSEGVLKKYEGENEKSKGL